MNGNDGTSDKRKAARDALLDAITAGVDEVKSEAGPVDHRHSRLKNLAETYALVVHGRPDAATKS